MDEDSVPKNLPAWIVNHALRYIRSEGREGHYFDSSERGEGETGIVPTLILATTGRTSGKTISIPLVYGKLSDEYVVIASKGGSGQPPSWYLNILQNPIVEVLVKENLFYARARVAVGEERLRLWALMNNVLPKYEEYQRAVDRVLPVIVLEAITCTQRTDEIS